MSPRAGLDKSVVVKAAADLVNVEGLDALSITRLATILGVQAPSIYNHVGGLEDIRRELALTGHRMLAECVAEATIGSSGPDALMKVADAYRAFIKTNPGIYAAGIRASGTMDPVDEELRAAEERVVRIVLVIIRSFGLDGDDGIHAARGLRSMVHGFTTLEISGGFGLPIDLDESFHRLVRLLIYGMEHQGEVENFTSPKA